MTALSPDGQELDRYITALAAGDREALAALYQRTSSAVYSFALSLCRHTQDAEDVLQDTYLQAALAAERYVPQGRPMAWLLTIARNAALSRLRLRQRTAPLEEVDWEPTVTDEDRLVLESLLAGLGEQERQIVALHAVAGLKHREIGELLGLPLATVLSKYSRALKKLRAYLREEVAHGA